MLGNAIGNSVFSFRQGYSRDAWAIFNAMTIKPDGDRKRLINNLVKGLIVDTLWPGKDCYYVMAAHTNDNGEAQINWKNPGTFDLILVNNPAFEADRGFTGNGTNQYIRTQYNPGVDAINYALNDASIGIYIRTNVAENSCDIGCYDSTPEDSFSSIVSRYSNNNFYGGVNQLNQILVENLDSRGYYKISRTALNTVKVYRNKGVIIDSSQVSNRLTEREIYILARNDDNVANLLSTKQIAKADIGKGLTQTNVNNETDRIEAFMDATGAGIIP